MGRQVSGRSKAFEAHPTFVRLFPGMSGFVNIQVTGRREELLATVAFVWPHAGMRAFVDV